MQELCKNIFTTPILLVNSPLKWINSYFIKGDSRNLIIDTAFNTAESWAIMQECMQELGFDPDKTDVFVTHLHADHSGLIAKLKNANNHIYVSRTDGALINRFQNPEFFDFITEINRIAGAPAEESLPGSSHVAYIHKPDFIVDFTYVAPGDTLTVGDYHFEVLDLSGHSPGQVGLYDPENGNLFCGDHILDRITPNIMAWDMEKDYLGLFLSNLKKLQEYTINRLFTAHRELPDDPQKRIQQLIDHHEVRLNEVLDILNKESVPVNAFKVASQMTWSVRKGFADFPLMQKWFACGEALSHLQHLYMNGKIQRLGDAQRPTYTTLS